VVTLSTNDAMLILEVEGLDKLWALKSRLEIPLAHILGATIDASRELTWKSLRLPGTYVPGVITAGTFYQHGKRMFWDVKNPENTIVIALHDDRYDELIVEVADPAAAVALITAALDQPTTHG
jgi:hypothetical protein